MNRHVENVSDGSRLDHIDPPPELEDTRGKICEPRVLSSGIYLNDDCSTIRDESIVKGAFWGCCVKFPI